MKSTAREIFGIFLILILGLLALGAWQSFFSAIVIEGVADSWKPTLWFCVLALCFFLGTAIWAAAWSRLTASAAVFLPGIFFFPSWEYAVVGILASALAFWSTMVIAQDLADHLRFRFARSVRTGTFFFVLGLSLALSSGYYVFLKNTSWEELVPRFRVGEEMTQIIFKVAGVVNPSFAELSQGDATVDEFLLSLEKNKKEADTDTDHPEESQDMPASLDTLNIPPAVSLFLQERGIVLSSDVNREKIEREIFLLSGREQIATLVGQPVEGDEKISDVLSLALQRKLIALLKGEKTTEHVASPAVPFFLALLLFFTLLSLISLLSVLCVAGAGLLFSGLLWIGWLKLDTIPAEQQRLAE